MKRKKTYTFFQCAVSLLLIVTLAWLTISLPFVNKHYQQKEKQATSQKADDSANNPFANTTEEKVPGNINEYLHGTHEIDIVAATVIQHIGASSPSLYIAYHSELLSPPPEL